MIRTVALQDMRRFGLVGRLALALGAASLAAAPVAAQVATPAAAAANNDDSGAGQPLDLPASSSAREPLNDMPAFRAATAIVNGAIITGTDIDQRMALVRAASEGEIDGEALQRLHDQVLSNLIDEMLEIQEANASDIFISDEEIAATYVRISQENFGLTTQQLDEYLYSIGSSPQSLKQQIRGELSWQRLLRRNIAPFINVSEEEVRERLARLEADKGTDEYRLGEIFVSATPENKAEVAVKAQQILEQLRKGGSFVAYARQFSEASTAAVGGDLGWVRLSQLPPELAATASNLQAGQLAGPIELRGGFSLLYLIDKRQVLVSDPRDALLSLKQISIDFPKNMTQEQANRRAGDFAAAIESINGCDDAEAGAAKIGAEVVSNDNVRIRDLPSQLQQTMLTLPPGGATRPFGSLEEGVRVLMLCARTDPPRLSGPSFDALMAQIEDERINKRAQIYLRDLRRDAVIEFN